MQQIIDFLISTIGSWGYMGIFLLMFLESSFFPFPSEVVMIPAGYLAQKGEMNLFLAIFIGAFGSLAGALFNYYLSFYLGRDLLLKYGRYIGITPQKMEKFETFFNAHGEIATFTSRLIPGIRQYISLPAGLAKMNITRFSLYTSLGAGIWVSILVALGYFIGHNEKLIHKYLSYITIGLMIAICLTLISYYFYQLKNRSHANKNIS